MIKEHDKNKNLETQLEKKEENIDCFQPEKKSLFTFSSTEKRLTRDQKQRVELRHIGDCLRGLLD